MTGKQKKILLLGSGYVAKPCADIILRRPENSLTIASRKLENAQNLVHKLTDGRVKACTVDVMNEQELFDLVNAHDLTVSLIPYTFHERVIKAAIKARKHVVTTSYINPQMAALDAECKKAGIVVMNEIGVDPGIDHLWAVKKISEVHAEEGEILEFISYCGGLPAPEVSNNPLGYKFSWSSRGVLLALRNSAKYIGDGAVVEIPGPQLMKSAQPIFTGYQGFNFVGYPNRDSSPYSTRYNIPEAKTVIRGTLRYACFPAFVQVLVDCGFLNEDQIEFLQPTNTEKLSWRQLTARLLTGGDSPVTDSHLINVIASRGNLAALSENERENILLGFKWLGLLSDDEFVEKRGTILDTLCATLEKKMAYAPGERDMVMLQHKFKVKTADGRLQTHLSTLLEFGKPHGTTAMAKTVGVPCGIAVQLILDGKLTKTGVIAPMTMDICQPLIDALEKENITMVEQIIE